jgi:hypothetical protein
MLEPECQQLANMMAAALQYRPAIKVFEHLVADMLFPVRNLDNSARRDRKQGTVAELNTAAAQVPRRDQTVPTIFSGEGAGAALH